MFTTKQHLKINNFYDHSLNAVMIQISYFAYSAAPITRPKKLPKILSVARVEFALVSEAASL